jgi:hypothetical protein
MAGYEKTQEEDPTTLAPKANKTEPSRTVIAGRKLKLARESTGIAR